MSSWAFQMRAEGPKIFRQLKKKESLILYLNSAVWSFVLPFLSAAFRVSHFFVFQTSGPTSGFVSQGCHILCNFLSLSQGCHIIFLWFSRLLAQGCHILNAAIFTSFAHFLYQHFSHKMATLQKQNIGEPWVLSDINQVFGKTATFFASIFFVPLHFTFLVAVSYFQFPSSFHVHVYTQKKHRPLKERDIRKRKKALCFLED